MGTWPGPQHSIKAGALKPRKCFVKDSFKGKGRAMFIELVPICPVVTSLAAPITHEEETDVFPWAWSRALGLSPGRGRQKAEVWHLNGTDGLRPGTRRKGGDCPGQASPCSGESRIRHGKRGHSELGVGLRAMRPQSQEGCPDVNHCFSNEESATWRG